MKSVEQKERNWIFFFVYVIRRFNGSSLVEHKFCFLLAWLGCWNHCKSDIENPAIEKSLSQIFLPSSVFFIAVVSLSLSYSLSLLKLSDDKVIQLEQLIPCRTKKKQTNRKLLINKNKQKCDENWNSCVFVCARSFKRFLFIVPNSNGACWESILFSLAVNVFYFLH